MTPKRPYLFRAMYEWILDNQLTPHIVVDAAYPGVQVPPSYVEENKITLNLETSAVHGFAMNNEALEFKASFDGRLLHVYIPIGAIIAVYALENHHCLVFGPTEINQAVLASMSDTGIGGTESGRGGGTPTPSRPKKGPPKLSIVK